MASVLEEAAGPSSLPTAPSPDMAGGGRAGFPHPVTEHRSLCPMMRRAGAPPIPWWAEGVPGPPHTPCALGPKGRDAAAAGAQASASHIPAPLSLLSSPAASARMTSTHRTTRGPRAGEDIHRGGALCPHPRLWDQAPAQGTHHAGRGDQGQRRAVWATADRTWEGQPLWWARVPGGCGWREGARHHAPSCGYR